MKNIRNYHPQKYDEKEYIKIKENIYEKTNPNESLSLKEITDSSLLKEIQSLDNWKNIEEDLLYIVYNGKKYYKDIDDEAIYENQSKDNDTLYVTSIMFEQEPEYDENDPSSPYISQYPLEDILDKYSCYCMDDYAIENKEDLVNSYIEFASKDIEDIEKLLEIVGKHVYNKKDGEYVKLIIE